MAMSQRSRPWSTKPADSSITMAQKPMPYWALPALATWASTWCTSTCIRPAAHLMAVAVQVQVPSASKSTLSPSYRGRCPPKESRVITGRTPAHNPSAKYAPTIYFPLIVHEAMMIEPTETETRETLDYFVSVMKQIAEESRTDPEIVKTAPHTTPVGLWDQALAARKPNL